MVGSEAFTTFSYNSNYWKLPEKGERALDDEKRHDVSCEGSSRVICRKNGARQSCKNGARQSWHSNVDCLHFFIGKRFELAGVLVAKV